MPTATYCPDRQWPAAPETGRRQDKGPRQYGRRQAAGASAAASAAGGLVLLVSVAARFPDRFLRAIGVPGWPLALVAVLVMVNGARVVAQAPFTFADRAVSAPRWGADQLKALGGAIVVGSALTIPLYALLRATTLWWLWAWALFSVVTVVAQAAMPVLARAQSGPLSPAGPELARQIGAVAARAGVDIGGGVLLAERATGKARCNAYVMGLGPTRRVVLEHGVAAWPPELVDQVVAHEIGHWRLAHAARRLPVTLAAQLATFALAGAMLSFPPLLSWAGVPHLGDPRSYPLLLVLTPLLVLPARLALAAYDRAQERRADRFALALLGDAAQFTAMLERAAGDGGAVRSLPWWRHCTASHPPIDERILACQKWSPT